MTIIQNHFKSADLITSEAKDLVRASALPAFSLKSLEDALLKMKDKNGMDSFKGNKE